MVQLVAAPTSAVDPITLEVVRHSLVAIMDEAEANLTRTAFSTIIREAKDYCVGMVTSKGETIAQSRGSIPTFVADLGSPTLDIMDILGDDIAEGDYIISNYAGVGGQHLNNVVMITPIFNNGQIIAFAALRTHWADVGGMGLTMQSTEIFQEGVQYRAIRVYQRDVLNRDVERIIRYNTRTPDATFGDLEAQVAACRLVKRRFEELVRRYSWQQVEAAIHECWDQSERYVRQRIREVPNGRYSGESFLDGDGITDELIPIRVTVTVDDDEVTIDFTHMPPQAAGPINSGATGGASSAAKVAFKGAIAPFLLPNEGEFRPLRVVTTPGTLVSASDDAPMAFWSTPIKTVIDVILQAFSQAIPDRIAAGSNAQYATVGLRGRDPDTGKTWRAGGGALGGWGAHLYGDGQSAMRTTTHGDTRQVPVEVRENESPAVVTRWELVPDSGGAGRQRGGLGTRLEVCTPTPAVVNINFDRAKFPPWGLFGGKDGMAGYGEVIEPEREPVQYTKVSGLSVPANTHVASVNNGGGGYGHPFERDLPPIEWDLRQGYVSREAALRRYGVMFDAHGEIDPIATAKHRALWMDVPPPANCC